ncbi:MAG: hypothetical protein K2H64_05615, partial [Desulfovibrio sp.]|nr:hypothetical protein [Desulfovibrio sp.]
MNGMPRSLKDRLARKTSLYFTKSLAKLTIGAEEISWKTENDGEKSIPIDDIRRIVLLGRTDIPALTLYDLGRLGIHID